MGQIDYAAIAKQFSVNADSLKSLMEFLLANRPQGYENWSPAYQEAWLNAGINRWNRQVTEFYIQLAESMEPKWVEYRNQIANEVYDIIKAEQENGNGCHC